MFAGAWLQRRLHSQLSQPTQKQHAVSMMSVERLSFL